MNELEQKQQFARDTYNAVRNILYNKYNVNNNNLAGYMTSQIMEESGWGQKPTGTYNYFGIKARKGEPYTEVLTTENINGKEQKLKQKFRNYENLEDGLNGYIDLLVNKYDILNHGYSIFDYSRQLKSKGYATRADYENRLQGVYNGKTFRKALDNYNPDIKIKQFEWQTPQQYQFIQFKKQGGTMKQKQKKIIKAEDGLSFWDWFIGPKRGEATPENTTGLGYWFGRLFTTHKSSSSRQALL